MIHIPTIIGFSLALGAISGLLMKSTLNWLDHALKGIFIYAEMMLDISMMVISGWSFFALVMLQTGLTKL